MASPLPIAAPSAPPTGEKRHQIDHRTIKLLVGLIAVAIGPLTSTLAHHKTTSISAAYYVTGWPQTVFIGFLFAIAALLAAYNGFSTTEMILSKIAAAAALGVALFPCGCDGHPELVPHAHYLFAAAMFLILADLSYGFYRRARLKPGPAAKARGRIYLVCTTAIVLAIVTLVVHALVVDAPADASPTRIIYYGELVALVAFGVSWLTASHFIPVITSDRERNLRKAGVDQPTV